MVLKNFPKARTFVIAEAGVNHSGDLNQAFELIDQAKNAGADVIKFQSYKTENLVLVDAEKPEYQKKNLPENLSQYKMLKDLELSRKQTEEIYEYAISKDINFMSTAYDADILKWVDGFVDVHKLASIDIVDHRLVQAASDTGKPVILSSAMATLAEVKMAVDIFKESDNLENLTVLQCIFNYPCKMEDLNLNVMTTYREMFQIKTGLSDHTNSIYTPSFAVAMGANVIEKHFTLDRNAPGPDHSASMEPNELKKMIELIRLAESARGSRYKEPLEIELPSRTISRKSLVSLEDIPMGTMITSEMIGAKRPGKGFFPTYDNLYLFVGKVAKRDIKGNEILERGMVE